VWDEKFAAPGLSVPRLALARSIGRMIKDGRYVRFYKPRSYKFTNKWLVRPCGLRYNATAELCPPAISPTIVLPEPSRIYTYRKKNRNKLMASSEYRLMVTMCRTCDETDEIKNMSAFDDKGNDHAHQQGHDRELVSSQMVCGTR
jgi:hypothetical protein